MITDEKRREVAQKLRELRHTTYYREEVVENELRYDDVHQDYQCPVCGAEFTQRWE